MRTRTALTVLGMLGAGAMGAAQESVSFTIKWDQAAVLPGQTQTGAVWAEFSPGVGGDAIWNTPGGGQPAVVMAFASSVGDLLNVLNGQSGTLSWTVPEALNVGLKPGTPDGQGGIKGTSAFQFGPPANPDPITDNPIRILDLAWTTDLGTPRTVVYRFDALSTKIHLDSGAPPWKPDAWTPIDSPDTGFEVVPSPAAWALVLFALPRRPRRSRTGG